MRWTMEDFELRKQAAIKYDVSSFAEKNVEKKAQAKKAAKAKAEEGSGHLGDKPITKKPLPGAEGISNLFHSKLPGPKAGS